jgi:hypothetical protein
LLDGKTSAPIESQLDQQAAKKAQEQARDLLGTIARYELESFARQ